MTVRLGINGFGRICRSFYRALLARGANAGAELVAVNDPFGDSETMAFLLKHDSVGGMLPNEVKVGDRGFSVDGNEVRKLEVREPTEIPWDEHGVDVVIESTGIFTARDQAAGHLQGGAKRVIISAPSGDADAMICMGVNDSVYDPGRHSVISNASCTTNCLAPMAKVLHDRFGIEQGLVTTVHAYTSDQQLQDMATVARSGRPDVRRMRGAALSIVPSTTGAARAIGTVLPELKGRLDGTALRVPVPTGSITDLVATVAADTTKEEINQAFAEAAGASSYRGVVQYTEEPLVSADIVGNPASDLLGPRHDGERPVREGARLVRQRVGLLQPPHRRGRLHRRLAPISRGPSQKGHAHESVQEHPTLIRADAVTIRKAPRMTPRTE